MVRSIALLTLLVAIAGCKSPQTFENPFMGRTTIEPPATTLPGTLPGAYDPNAGTAPLFNPNTSTPAAAPPATLVPTTPASPVTPATPPPPGLPQYGPPGGFEFRQTQTTPGASTTFGSIPPPPPPATVVRPAVISSPSQSRWGAADAATMPATGNLAQTGAAGTQVAPAAAVVPAAAAEAQHLRNTAPGDTIRIAGAPSARIERPKTSVSGASGGSLEEPGRLPEHSDAIDIMDLPPAKQRQANKRPAPAVRQTSYEEPLERSEPDAAQPAAALRPQKPAKAAPQRSVNHASYGHGEDYAWLKGRLEYSNIDRRWKLRYIPIDGQTDAHGGSVLLPEAALLEGFESGDFVAVQGTLGRRTSSGFAPEYTVSRIKRLDQ